MSEVLQVESIVKKYFDNAVIIDDQMSFEEIILPVFTDQELGEIPDEYAVAEIAASIQTDLNMRPQKLLQQLTMDGFVAYPYKYSTQDVDVQMRFLSKVLDSSKLLFIDWNLEGYKPESPEKPGKAAIEILNHYADNLVGLKCAVIYTQEECHEVMVAISDHFEVIDSSSFFFQEKGKIDGNSLFGFVMKKNTEPNEIVEKISQILLKDKCIPIHIMDSASRLEKSITNAIHKFNAPFEKVLLTQILSSDIKNESIPKFLDDTLLSNMLSEGIALQSSNFLFDAKKQKIREKINAGLVSAECISQFCSVVEFKGKDTIVGLFRNPTFMTNLQSAFSDNQVDSFEKLKAKIVSILPDPSISKRINEIVLVLVLIVDFIDNQQGFKQAFLEQTYYFTKLLKYVDTQVGKIHTGSIFKVKDEDKYLLCITPFCDTHRPAQKVENIFKFIIGKVVGAEKDTLKNDGDNYACTGVPFSADNTVKFIKWDFYNVISMKQDDVASSSEKITTLRKEYIQNIINRYISYQARAGVNELFYKETYRETFYSLF